MKAICDPLNNTPRKCLGCRTPTEAFRDELIKLRSETLATTHENPPQRQNVTPAQFRNVTLPSKITESERTTVHQISQVHFLGGRRLIASVYCPRAVRECCPASRGLRNRALRLSTGFHGLGFDLWYGLWSLGVQLRPPCQQLQRSVPRLCYARRGPFQPVFRRRPELRSVSCVIVCLKLVNVLLRLLSGS